MRNPRVVRHREFNAAADVVWAHLADLSRHGDFIPLTRVDAPKGDARPGDRVVARTAAIFVDRMRVLEALQRDEEVWTALAILRKEGPLLLGTAAIAVRSRGPGRCTAFWAEDVYLPGPALVTRLLAPVLDLVLAAMGTVALRRLARALRRRRGD